MEKYIVSFLKTEKIEEKLVVARCPKDICNWFREHLANVAIISINLATENAEQGKPFVIY